MSVVEVRIEGPLFDGRTAAAVQAAVDDAVREVGNQGLSLWSENLDQSIRHPTPYYETQVNVRHHAGESVVNDRGIIYGPWLEGVGSRNRTTRFKGYFSLRRAVQELERQKPGLVQAVVDRHLRGAS